MVGFLNSKQISKVVVKEYPEIGTVTYKRNRRAKRLTLSIKAGTEIRVTIPGFLSFKSAEQFVLSKAEWIKEKQSIRKSNAPIVTPETGYATKLHKLSFIPVGGDSLLIKRRTPKIEVYYPKHWKPEDTAFQNAAETAIETAWRAEAKAILPQRVEELANMFGYSFSSVSIKKTKSRWGSCSSRNNINLSIYLMKLPDELIDYVILHELAHTKEKNHGPKFWEELNRVTNGNAKVLAKMVKAHRTGL